MKNFIQFIKYRNLIQDQDIQESIFFDINEESTKYANIKNLHALITGRTGGSTPKPRTPREKAWDPEKAETTPYTDHSGENQAPHYESEMTRRPIWYRSHRYGTDLSDSDRELIFRDGANLKPHQEFLRDSNELRVKLLKKNIKRPGYHTFGWKLHLNADPEHHEEISNYLKKHGISHKTGYYGSGKDVTVYTGSKHNTHEMAHNIQRDLAHILKPNHKNVIKSGNIPVTPHTSARFSIGYYDHRHSLHGGHKGVENLAADNVKIFKTPKKLRGNPSLQRKTFLPHLDTKEKRNSAIEQAHQNAVAHLTKNYGEFFTGKSNHNYGW